MTIGNHQQLADEISCREPMDEPVAAVSPAREASGGGGRDV
jgi:hypothetical protein